MSTPVRQRATELEYLLWFRHNVDFGPAEGDVIYCMNRQFVEETGLNLPKGWDDSLDMGETSLDDE